MIKSLIKLAVVLVIGILIYNYFLGTDEEKATSKAIFHEVRDVAVGVKELVKSEKEKFDEGKYDDAVEKIGLVLTKLKKTAKNIDEKYLSRIDELNKKRQQLKEELSTYENEDGRIDTSKREQRKIERDTAKIKRELDELMKETESLINDMEKK